MMELLFILCAVICAVAMPALYWLAYRAGYYRGRMDEYLGNPIPLSWEERCRKLIKPPEH
jgi:hypothetical protein